MANTETQAAGAAAAEAAEGGLLDQILTQSKIARSDTERTRARDLIAELVSQVSDGAMVVSKDAIGALDARIAEIDRVLSEKLSSVMHAPEFQQLAGSWRGLKYLVDNSETSTNLKIKVFNTTKKELVKDFKSASDFDQSTLFKKLYEEEYGTFGGAPFATLIGDFEFGRHPEDMYLVEEISHVCAAAHAPFLSAASPELLGFDDFTELSGPRDLAKIFDTVEYAKWKSFRASEDSRYVGLAMPHVLGRLGLARGEDHLLVSWLEQAPDERQTLVLGRYDDAWRQAHHVRVATLSARGRASGIPRLQWHDDAAWLVWTDVAGDVPGLHGARVRRP